MRTVLVLLLVVLTASIASAETWGGQNEAFQLYSPNRGAWINVLITATDMGTYWNWTYALEPSNANGIESLRITLGTGAAMVSNITGPSGWNGFVSGFDVCWQASAGEYTLDSDDNETFTYGFDHPLGPAGDYQALAMDSYEYLGSVPGPVLPEPDPSAVPEPMAVLLGLIGISSVAGFGKLRSK